MLDITKVNEPIKVLGIFFTYNKHNNRELDFDLTFTYMPLTSQSKFNYLYISLLF